MEFLGLRSLRNSHRRTVTRAGALDVEFRDVDIDSGCCILVEAGSHLRRRHVVEVEIMRLNSDAIDKTAVLQ